MEVKARLVILATFLAATTLLTGTWAVAGAPASPATDATEMIKPDRESLDFAKDPGDVVDFAAALAAGGDYLRKAQADITEDNAGNGPTDTDPQDGGWDWELTDPVYDHSTGNSPKNIYGATAQGLLQAYLVSGDAGLATAMDDAANFMIGDAGIRSAADLIFLMNYNDLPYVTGTAYMDAARAKFDGRVLVYGSGAALVEYIRDARAGQGYENGIIGWDNGAWVVAVAMLDDRYPGNGYAAEATAMAEVLYQDSFNNNPGYFDILDDQIEDPVGNNNWWYNLGITGLIDAFSASGARTEEIAGLVTILLQGQHTNGAMDEAYGTAFDWQDWQTTAYAALTLANLDQVTYQREINKMAYWLAAWQDPVHGAWVYSDGDHLPEIGGECTAALSYGASPTNVWVDDDFVDQAAVDAYNTANGTDLVWGYDAFASVQDGVDGVSGSTVTVLAGVYTEQVHITTDGLVLTGAGVDVTIIKSPVTLTESFETSPNFNYPVVFIDGAVDVAVSGLTIDGDNQGDTNPRFIGAAFWNGGGSLTDAKVINVMNSTFSGAQHGVGVYAYNITGGPYTVALNNVLVDDFQKTAVALAGDGLTVDLDHVTTIGEGSTTVTAQNGIQIALGAGGTVDNCSVSDVDYTGSGNWAASGMLLWAGAHVAVTNLDVDATNTSIYCEDTSADFDGGDITNPKGDGMYAYSTGAKSLTEPRLAAQPFDVGSKGGGGKAAITVSVQNMVFAGANLADSWGLGAWGYGPCTFTVSGCEFRDWEYGVLTIDYGGASYDTQINNNSIHDNMTAGFYTNAATTADASCNWWGDIGGPDYAPFNPNPAGDAITDGAVFWPWLDAVAGNCDQYGDNNIGAVDPLDCITPTNTCVTIPVVFNRLDVIESRGVHVVFELSPELVLCTPSIYDDIDIATGAGSWSDGFTNINHQVVDHGGGIYTVDRAILGTPCGPTVGGDLFFVQVAKAAGVTTDAVGTLTVTEVLVRDCDNAPLPGIPGAPAEVVIDLTSPLVLADLTATQVKTGNDSDGTTEITLAWTAPGGDADFIDIWRKGYGDYPEYDDGTGAVPAPPVTVANGWVLVTTVDAAVTSYPDEPDDRDFWYYAAFVTDGCGNISDASALTDGTLNYHLGDVHDTSNPGDGDNLVDTSDISHLGYNYGIALVHNAGLNYLDVGPTTDYSVDALPTTDNMVQFEDLMMFAINYGQVSKSLQRPAPASRNAIALQLDPMGGVGTTFAVQLRMQGDGQVQGLSVPLRWDDTVVEPINYTAGDLLASQGGLNLVVSPEPGTVDAALFGVRDAGISGEGLLATVLFRVRGEGDSGIELGQILARDAENAIVQIDGADNSVVPGALPDRSVLNANVPNPFNPSTKLSFSLAREGHVNLSIYTLQGRLVCSLIDGEMAAGPHERQWYGLDASGRAVSSGTYLVRLVAPDNSQSRQITLIK